MTTPAEPKVRSPWLTDAKWVVGILAVFVVAATALVTTATRLTEREIAVSTVSVVMATMFSPQGLDDPADVEKLRADLRAKPGGTTEAFPGTTISAAEIEGKSPREVRTLIFRKVAEPIYDRGSFQDSDTKQLGAGSLGAEGAEAKSIGANEIGFLALLSNESHHLLLGIQRVLIGASIGLLLLLILFSTGFGRLASPGWVLITASFVPAVASFVASRQLPTTANPAGNIAAGDLMGSIAGATSAVAPNLVAIPLSIYQPMLMTGLALVLFATIIGPFVHLWQRHRANAALPDHSKKA